MMDHKIIKATKQGNHKLVEQLIKSGSNMNAQDKNGHTALMLAVKNSRYARVTTLANGNKMVTLSFKLIAHYLMKAKANVNLTNKDGDTALTLAVSGGHFQLVRMLLAAGAKTTIKNNNNESAISLAKKQPSSHIHKVLLDAAVHLDIKNFQNNKSLSFSKINSSLEQKNTILQKSNIRI